MYKHMSIELHVLTSQRTNKEKLRRNGCVTVFGPPPSPIFAAQPDKTEYTSISLPFIHAATCDSYVSE